MTKRHLEHPFEAIAARRPILAIIIEAVACLLEERLGDPKVSIAFEVKTGTRAFGDALWLGARTI